MKIKSLIITQLKEGAPMEERSKDRIILNDRGNILIICVVIIMILTSLGLYSLSSTNVELTMAGRDKQENINFQRAEEGMRFAQAQFMSIYRNQDSNGNPLYTSDPTTQNNPLDGPGFGGVVSFAIVASNLVLTATNPPLGNPLALRDMNLGTGAIAFQYNNQNNIPVALIEIRDILFFNANTPTAKDITIEDERENSVAKTFQLLTPFANLIPNESHLGPPPLDYDDTFKGRNYLITSTALTNGGILTGSQVQVGVKVAILKDHSSHLNGL